MKDKLSVLLPAYNEEKMINKACNRIAELLDKAEIVYEIIVVDDGSKDGTWTEIKKEAQNNQQIKGIRFSRNFGKEAAIFAGLEQISGDCCVVMDCDLQHPPETILEMYALWKQGYEVVEGVKEERGKESKLHRICAAGFYKMISIATNIDMSKASDFKLLDKKAVQSLLEIKEEEVFFRALSSWIGFKTTKIAFHVQERELGESKWSFLSLVKYALKNITSFTAAPMQIVTFLGMIMFFVSIGLGILAFWQKVTGIATEGFTTVIILQLFSSSIIMFSLGVMGYYLAKIYEEVKGRPRSIVAEKCGIEKNG